jgi:Helix-turn-helix
MQATRDDVEILPVIVTTRVFPARPSAIPDIRDFVREQLSKSPLSTETIRALDFRVADVLLDAAGTSDTIQVSLRIFDDCAEVDVLQAPIEVRPAPPASTGTVIAFPSPHGVAAPAAVAAPTAVAAPVARSSGTFAEWLAEALRREGMTMESAARQLKVSVKTVSRWVRGATEPRLCDLSRIRDLFGELPFP